MDSENKKYSENSNIDEKYKKYKCLEGKILDQRYLLEKLIGVGGMAVVFRAVDKKLNDTVVAIKMLKEEVAADSVMVKRFRSEAAAETLLKHSNIVAVNEIELEKDIKYMVMEYVYGITLKNYLIENKKPLSFEEIISYTTQILKALRVAHGQGIIHRDIKPQNIMVLKNGKIKVMDFGIAKLPNAETVTVTDKAIGTVYYMSPEQASSKGVDKRSDIYSLGAMMYELATGTLPFRADSPVGVLIKQIKEEPIPPRTINRDIPVGLEQIILCAMSKNPKDRFQTAEEMLQYIDALKNNRKIKFSNLPSQGVMKKIKAFFKRTFGKKK